MLFRHILNDSHYEPNVRPAHNATAGPTELQMGVELIQMYGIVKFSCIDANYVQLLLKEQARITASRGRYITQSC